MEGERRTTRKGGGKWKMNSRVGGGGQSWDRGRVVAILALPRVATRSGILSDMFEVP